MLYTFPVNADKSPKVPNWQNYTGESTSENYGLCVPENFIIIDLDLYKNPNLINEIASLDLDLNFENAFLQTTKNGGKHYAFKTPEDTAFKQGSNILGVIGFDTRIAKKGYIVSGKGYTTKNNLKLTELFNDNLPELSQKAVKILSIEYNKSTENSSFNLCDVAVKNPSGNELSKQEIKDILFNLPADIGSDNDSWFTVCAGLKRQILSSGISTNSINRRSHWGYKLLDDWSKTRAGYSQKIEKSNFARWRSINNDDVKNAITFRSVVELSDYKLHIKSQKESDDYLEDWYILGDKYYSIERGNLFSEKSFNNIETANMPADEKGKKPLPSRHYMGRIRTISHESFDPNNKDVVFTNDQGLNYYLNTYKAPRRPKNYNQDNFNLFVKHIEFLTSEKDEQEYILYYSAFLAQFPGKLKGWAIVLQGCQGCGKSVFTEILAKAIGVNNTKTVDVNNDVYSNFNAWATDSIFNVVEEVKVDGHNSYHIIDKLKRFITNSRITITKKGRDPYDAVNTTNYMFLTNYKDAIPVKEDRRYCFIFSKWQDKNELDKFLSTRDGKQYFEKIYKIKDYHCDDIYEGLLRVNIPQSFMQQYTAPMTKAKSSIMQMCVSDEELCVKDAIEQFKEQITINKADINVTTLQELVISNKIDSEDYDEFPNKKLLKKILLTLGYHWKARKRINGKLCTVYTNGN